MGPAPCSLASGPCKDACLKVTLRAHGRRRLRAIEDDLQFCPALGKARREVRRHDEHGIDLVPADHLLPLLQGCDKDRLKILRSLREAHGLAGQGRTVFDDHGRRHVLDIEAHAVPDDQNQHERQHDAERQAAVVAQEFARLLAHQCKKAPPESTCHDTAPFALLSFSASLRACSTIATKMSSMVASGRRMRWRISSGLPSTSILP